MKRIIFFLFSFAFWGSSQAQLSFDLVTSTKDSQWDKNENVVLRAYNKQEPFDIEVLVDDSEQIIDGFGGCFNELGWEALIVLDDKSKKSVFSSLFSPEGCNFTICRMSIGANDFAVDWYSLNETPGDYAMENFSIERDRQRVIPYIKSAMEFKPDLQIWGSPWCPPSWMKKNGYYACSPSQYNDLDSSLPRRENGDTDFIADEKTLSAYALYFMQYVRAYQDEGINIYAVHVQNEPHSCQPFPSCLWKGPDLKNFIRDYLGPAFSENNLDTEIWYGTLERPYEGEWIEEIDGVLEDSEALRYITGVGFQWAGKGAIAAVHKKNPGLKLMHTETECGDGENTWQHAEYVYELWRHYFDNGVNSQLHWNMILRDNSRSTWGWRQNSMISVDSTTKAVKYNPEFYVVKHFSHFIQPTAHKINIRGNRTSELAFKNPDGLVIVAMHNEDEAAKNLTIKINERLIALELPGNSISTLALSGY